MILSFENFLDVERKFLQIFVNFSCQKIDKMRELLSLQSALSFVIAPRTAAKLLTMKNYVVTRSTCCWVLIKKNRAKKQNLNIALYGTRNNN